jgi:ABC-2 type transport system permease protein
MFVADLLLGGYFLPLHLYPEMVRQALIYSPLGAMTYAPASILSGFAPPSEWPLLLAVQLGWVLLFAFAANLVFRRGVRRFGGVSQ